MCWLKRGNEEEKERDLLINFNIYLYFCNVNNLFEKFIVSPVSINNTVIVSVEIINSWESKTG